MAKAISALPDLCISMDLDDIQNNAEHILENLDKRNRAILKLLKLNNLFYDVPECHPAGRQH